MFGITSHSYRFMISECWFGGLCHSRAMSSKQAAVFLVFRVVLLDPLLNPNHPEGPANFQINDVLKIWQATVKKSLQQTMTILWNITSDGSSLEHRRWRLPNLPSRRQVKSDRWSSS